MNLDITALGLQYIDVVFQQYFAGIEGILGLFVVCLLVVLGLAGKKERELFVYPVLALAFVVYNPFVMVPVIEKLSLSQRYYRYLWLLPIGLVIGFAVIKLLERIPGKLLKVISVISILFVFTFIGNSVWTMYGQTENIFKIPNETIEVDNIIKQSSGEDQPICVYADGYTLSLRQYDASVISLLSRKQLLNWNIDPVNEAAIQDLIDNKKGRYILALLVRYGVAVDSQIIQTYLEKYEVDYIVLQKQFGLSTYMQSLNVTLVGNTNSLDVYMVNK